MYPTQLHSYLLWRSSVDPAPQTLASKRYTAAVSLMPAAMCGVFVYGWYAALVLLTCLVSAFLADFLCRRFVYRREAAIFNTRDGVWLLSGMLVGLMLPPAVSLPIAAAGAVVAVLAGKYLLQVDGMPLLQPALLGLLALHLVFNSTMNPREHWPRLEHGTTLEATTEGGLAPNILLNIFRGDIRNSIDRQKYIDDLLSNQPITAEAVYESRPQDLVAAMPWRDLSSYKRPPAEGASVESYDWLKMLLGNLPATIGGSSGLALLFGIALLVFSRAVSLSIPFFAMLVLFAGLELTAWLSGASPDARAVYGNIPIHLLSGGTLLGVFYFAADPTVAPRSTRGKIYAGVLFGLCELLLRLVFRFSDGVLLSALAAQGMSFVIDQWLAPPELPTHMSSVHIGLSQSSLGRL